MPPKRKIVATVEVPVKKASKPSKRVTEKTPTENLVVENPLSEILKQQISEGQEIVNHVVPIQDPIQIESSFDENDDL